jgi:hypothetical protein
MRKDVVVLVPQKMENICTSTTAVRKRARSVCVFAQQVCIKTYFLFDRSTWKIIMRIYKHCFIMDLFIFLAENTVSLDMQCKKYIAGIHFKIFYGQKVDN